VVQTPRPETYTQLDPTTGQGVSGKRKAGKVLGQGGGQTNSQPSDSLYMMTCGVSLRGSLSDTLILDGWSIV
jgi:hypothetical protein